MPESVGTHVITLSPCITGLSLVKSNKLTRFEYHRYVNTISVIVEELTRWGGLMFWGISVKINVKTVLQNVNIIIYDIDGSSGFPVPTL